MNFSGNKITIKNKKTSLNSSYSPFNASFSPVKKSNQNQQTIETLRKEVDFHRAKNEQSLMKVKFLKNKLLFHGDDDIPKAIVEETGKVDERIRQLEKMLFFKKSQQMEKLRQKLKGFLLKIEFKVEDEVIQEFEDEVELMLFLVDAFGERYKELMAEISSLKDKCKGQTLLKLNTDLKASQVENQKLFKYSKELEIQLFKTRKTLYEQNDMNFKRTGSNLLDENVVPPAVTLKMQEFQKQKKIQHKPLMSNSFSSERKNEKDEETSRWMKKCRQLERQLDSCRMEEQKWKQRYEIMERKKEERIHILEKQLSFGFDDYHHNRRMVSNSSQEYFDL